MEPIFYDDYDQRTKGFITFSSSILIHTVILFLCIRSYIDKNHLEEPIDQSFYAPSDKSMPAALKPKAPPFGLPIQFLSHEPEEQQEEHQSSEQSHITHESTIQDSESISQELIHEIASNTEKLEKQETAQQLKPIPKSESNSLSSSKKSFNTLKNLFHRRSEMKTITFADLARGFIENIKDEGNDLLKRDGDPDKRPDQEDLKRISYMQKIIWYMQNEWRIEEHKIAQEHFPQLVLTVLVTIAQDGKVVVVNPLQPSGNKVYDDFIMDGIKRASPYPPVPQHFNTSAFDLVLSIYCMPQQKPWSVNLQSSTL